MKPIKNYLILIVILSTIIGYTQKKTIEFELNGRSEKATKQNPFKKFIGEWTLKNNDWTQNWGNGTETIKIPNHHTVSQAINTNNSLLSIIDGPEPNGHIFWSYNPNTKKVQHLSSFGAIRAGSGKGTINENGDVKLKLTFEGEPKDTYRIYNYKWVSADEYHMKSVQFSKNNTPTGLFYEGNFIRVKPLKHETIKDEIAKILKVIDNNDISIEEQLAVYADDVIHMAPNNEVIKDKATLKTYLETQRSYGTSKMTHHIISVNDFEDKIIMRGAVIGHFHPANGETPIAFKTKNLFVFKRINGVLKISTIIYNMSPNK